jgi:UDP-N-acetylglucosamine 2-epimerase (non-hydrolysing)/GDP/UDP-N,N'-diacetylbacillosamine 2-epimerase (hydrolysing)
MTRRQIAVFTGNRAEYGLQRAILEAIDRRPALEYKLLVSGAHLDKDFGRTLDEIRADGFHIESEIKIDMPGDHLVATAHAIGSGILSMTKTLAELKPDILVVYADRFEGFAAVVAGTQMGIPTAHVEGGDLTEGGALDDSVRHAMTKLAHLHFTTNQQATNRVLALGEESWRVHTVGFPVLDLIERGEVASPDDIAARLGLDPAKPIVVFTQHSVATEFEQAAEQIAPIIEGLKILAGCGVQIVATYPNNDAGGRRIIAALKILAAEQLPGIVVRPSLGRALYHGLLALATDRTKRVVCAGNSSSGIKETPIFGCPTVNIGSRQRGRLRAENVLDCGYDRNEFVAAVEKAFHDEDFREQSRTAENPYGQGGSGNKIADVLETGRLDRTLIQKRMTLRGEIRDGWFR